VSITDDARAAARADFPDWVFAPNIGGHPGIYEIENCALDPGGHVLAAMRRLAPWEGRTLVDLGCGTGFWLTGYARDAGRVVGIEPDPALRARAVARTRGLPVVEVMAGSAERLPLADHSVDVVHARFAYFLAPGTDRGGDRPAGGGDGSRRVGGAGATHAVGGAGATPAAGGAGASQPAGGRRATGGGDAGLAEVMRVLAPGGSLVVVDNDYRWGQFAELLAAASKVAPQRTAGEVDAWWQERGATRHQVRSQWSFASRAELAAVLGIEFPAAVARAWLARHPAATSLSYGYVLYCVSRSPPGA
jgi:ubiquinone/menaquinone biosynthesis C-methylase UbiE